MAPPALAGTALLNELLQRGHRVTPGPRSGQASFARRPDRGAGKRNGRRAGGPGRPRGGRGGQRLQPGWTHPDLHDEFLRGSRAITAGVKAAGVQRLLVVGGAGSLVCGARRAAGGHPSSRPNGKTAHWPPAKRNLLRQESTLQWVPSPAILLEPGERTGHYRLGTESP